MVRQHDVERGAQQEAVGSVGNAIEQQPEHLGDDLVPRERAGSHVQPPEHQLVARLIRQLVIIPHPVRA